MSYIRRIYVAFMVYSRLMNIKELFTGGREVKEARCVIRELKDRRSLSKNNTRRLDEARRITRRHFLKISGAALGLAAGTGLGVWKLQDFLENRESDDDVRNSYLEAFRSIAIGDPQGERLINFYERAARRAHYRDEDIIADEEGTRGENFWVAVVEPDHRIISFQTHGIAAYDNNQDILTLKRLKISEIWKGALFGHEVSHAFDDIVKLEEKTQKAFDLGEVEAYDFELHLLDRTTGGQLKDRMRTQAGTIAEGKMRGMLSSQDFSAFDSLFPNAVNSEEVNLRTVTYTIGINFAAIESRYSIPEDITKEKINYIRSVFEGRIPIVPLP